MLNVVFMTEVLPETLYIFWYGIQLFALDHPEWT